MKIGITGASGFVGKYLCQLFDEKGWSVQRIGRNELAFSDKELAAKLSGVDAIVNLAGANIAQRWNDDYKRLIFDSRIGVTRKLIEAIALMENKPKTFISTSAVGIYDSKEKHTESSTIFANDYLSNVCREWEKEANRAVIMNVRTVIFRFGIVLGKNGGMLARMLPPFKIGVGGPIGNGKQFLSWIHLDDLGAAVSKAVSDADMHRIYNLTAPYPVTNREMTRTLATLLSRPAFFPVPLFLLRLIFGEGAGVISSGQYALPDRLIQEGFVFRFPNIEQALQDILNK